MGITPDMLAAMFEDMANTSLGGGAARKAYLACAKLVREHLGRTPGILPDRADIPENSDAAHAAAERLEDSPDFRHLVVLVSAHEDGWQTRIWGATPPHRAIAAAMADACLDGLSVNPAPPWLEETFHLLAQQPLADQPA